MCVYIYIYIYVIVLSKVVVATPFQSTGGDGGRMATAPHYFYYYYYYTICMSPVTGISSWYFS